MQRTGWCLPELGCGMGWNGWRGLKGTNIQLEDKSWRCNVHHSDYSQYYYIAYLKYMLDIYIHTHIYLCKSKPKAYKILFNLKNNLYPVKLCLCLSTCSSQLKFHNIDIRHGNIEELQKNPMSPKQWMRHNDDGGKLKVTWERRVV